LALWLYLLAFCLGSTPAHALDNSALEERSVERALGPKPDREPAPEGKRIERVEIVRLPVFDEDDPVPDLVNVFHGQTREAVIRRELLFRAGDLYRSEQVLETVRNLQGLPQFGVVVVVALKGTTPDRVRLVVIVRDVWSLRLAYELRGTFKSLNYLLINPSEWNFLGTRTQVGGVFSLAPDRYSVGGIVIHPRVAGSKVDALAQGQVFVNLDSGKAEGSMGQLALYRDLISLSDKWGFVTGASWLNEQTRLYSDRRLVLSDEGIPVAYHTNVVRGGAQVTRSYGRVYKYNLTFGVELAKRQFNAERAAETSPEAFASFVKNELPVSDTRLSPFVQLEHKTSKFLATRDVETLELRESFALGELAALRLYPALHALGSTRNLFGSVAWAGYTWPIDTGLLRVVANSSIEAADEARHQATAQGALRFVSPQLASVRLVVDSALGSTYRNYLNRKLLLGGDTRPRGYTSSIFRGGSAFAGTAELRTSAVNILSARVGAVAFYDLGGTGDYVSQLALHQSVGVGVRILLPQLNREVFRVDWAAPLTAGRGRFPDRALPGAVYFAFGQAFEMPGTRLPSMFGAETSLLQPTR
jgi:hypothetical protein